MLTNPFLARKHFVKNFTISHPIIAAFSEWLNEALTTAKVSRSSADVFERKQCPDNTK